VKIHEAEAHLTRRFNRLFTAHADSIATQAADLYNDITKAAAMDCDDPNARHLLDLIAKHSNGDKAQHIVNGLHFPWSLDPDTTTSDLATDAATKQLNDAAVTDSDTFHTVNANAVAWADKHAGDLITDISDGTRHWIQPAVVKALREGFTAQELKSEILDGYAFSNARALAIARTEVAHATNAGDMIGAHGAGMDTKSWLASGDSCDDCNGNEDDGEIGIDEDYSSGVDRPPAHTSCGCSQSYSRSR
jgi:uncharacterized protein with gpF-like domain